MKQTSFLLKSLQILLILIIALNVQAQNVGVNEPNPTNALHVRSVNPTNDPLRVEGLQNISGGEQAVLIQNTLNGVVKYITIEQLKDSTDSYLDSLTLQGTTLLGWVNGQNYPVDLSSLIGSDNQNLTGANLDINNILTIDIQNGASTSVDLTGLLGSDNQNLTNAVLNGTELTIEIQNGSPVTVDLAALIGTDNQDLTSAVLDINNILTIDIQNGASTSVDLSSLSDHDWYVSNSTDVPTDINQSIYTFGRVGIGTDNPLSSLHLRGPAMNLFLENTAASGNLYTLNSTGAGDFRIIKDPLGAPVFPFTIAGVNDFIGINTTGPINQLDVSGNMAVGTFAANQTAPANGAIVSGNVRVGVPNAATISPALTDQPIIKLDVSNGYTRLGNYNSDPGGGQEPGTSWAGGVGALAIGMNRTAGHSHVDFWNTTNPQAPADAVVDRGFQWRRYDAGANEEVLMTLWGDGDLIISGGTFGTSDARVKSNFRTMQSPVLDKVLQLNPKTYLKKNPVYKNGLLYFESANEPKQDFGFIAQELYDLFPELVNKPQDESTQLWSVDYSRLSVFLTLAIQEQQAVIENQNSEIEGLKSEMESLKKQMQELIKKMDK
ncbi:MAG: tail fiber domain-containing protein [Crocinitomicaceae bacterium]|nr:tail fiber domain-containing protein [Crocinitomicaceae bacterium]